MVLHITDDRACELAAELAALTGETQARAVTMALEERLDRERARPRPRKKATVEEILAIGRQVVRDLGYQPDLDHTAFLYDERGMPK
ncbi:MAG: transcription factor [Acidobacteria bacterium]|nr:transcription factor [Acidobacteriota bacterium]